MKYKRGAKKVNNNVIYTIRNNKGLSFVELIIAIALLAVLVGPIMKSILASGQVNMQARKIMSANEVARGIMEGITGNSYAGLLDSYKEDSFGNGESLSHMGSDVYNSTTNRYIINVKKNAPFNSLACTFNSTENVNYISTTGGSYKVTDLAGGTKDQTKVNALATEYGKYIYDNILSDSSSGFTTDDQMLFMCGDNTDKTKPATAKCLFLGYTNVELADQPGYKYDVICFVVPANKADNAKYYSYNVTVAVYPVERGVHKCTEEGATPVLTVRSGLRNR